MSDQELLYLRGRQIVDALMIAAVANALLDHLGVEEVTFTKEQLEAWRTSGKSVMGEMNVEDVTLTFRRLVDAQAKAEFAAVRAMSNPKAPLN